MDNQPPQLDLKFYEDICPDRNVPVIVVFAKELVVFGDDQIRPVLAECRIA